MRNAATLLIASAIGVTLWSVAPGYSQTPAPHSAAERRKALEERETKSRMKIEQSNQKLERSVGARLDKRRACSKEAKQLKLSFYQRRHYVKQCMAR